MSTKIITSLRRLLTLADESLANRILAMERLKSAQLRVDLYEREQRHICLEPGCRQPVVGKWIFEHCERHLRSYERHWLEDGVEESGGRVTREAAIHPMVADVKAAIEERDIELSRQIAARKDRALSDAREMIERAHALELERRAFLPENIRRSIKYPFDEE